MRSTALIGLGTMGPGIAARLARGGIHVTAYDTSAAALDRAPAMVGVAAGALDRLGIKAPPAGPGRISFTASLEDAIRGADLVIENVPEKIEIKEQVYRAIDPMLGPDTIVVSDTSGIPITKLQAFLSRPERMAGMHWSNPPHIIPMIEVIAGEHTAPETAEAVRALIRRLGLLPVTVKKDVPGFVENRVLYALLREAVDLVETGVIEPEDLDTCVSWGIGYKLAVIGPMRLLDMAGLDIYTSVASFLNQDLCDRKDMSALARDKAARGEFGMKSGKGMFDYTAEEIPALQAERAAKLIAIRKILEGKEGA